MQPELKPGTFCWIELGTSDNDAAKSFYTQLFDWEYVDNPMGPDQGVYTILKLDGKDIGGLYKLMPDMVAQGIPPNWMSYVAVTSADESVEKAKAEGATIMNGPFDVSTMGRMAVIQDPTGAVFSIWEAKEHKGSGGYGAPGFLCWNELGTRDPEKAGQFYSNLFGWTRQPFPESPVEYTIFNNGDRGIGGMYRITPEMGSMPPNWLPYFAVEDCDAKVQKATELGGQVMMPPDDIPGIGRFAILIDPQGAVFAIIKTEPHQ